VDVGAAGSPPPLPAASRLVVGLAWARIGTAVAGTVVAGILVVFGASQLVGWVGNLDIGPDPSNLVAAATPTPNGDHSINPDPAVEPSLSPEPSATPIPSFIPLPSLSPNEQPPDAPSAPSLQLSGVTAHTMSIRWTDGPGGGPVQKWEIWRRNGTGQWFKLGELAPGAHTLTNSQLSASTSYSYRVRGVNVAWLGPFSNVITATTAADPTAPPTPAPTNTPLPTDTPPPPTPEPTPEPTPTPTPEPTPTPAPPQCSDGQDNDGDTFVDFGPDPGVVNDPECADPSDNDESL
jgi:hypothetical protein